MKLSDSARAYLHSLGLEQEPPSLSFLERICLAHLNTYPFENISKLIYFRDHAGDKWGIRFPRSRPLSTITGTTTMEEPAMSSIPT